MEEFTECISNLSDGLAHDHSDDIVQVSLD